MRSAGLKFVAFAFAMSLGEGRRGISGGDRILINFARIFASEGAEVNIFTTQGGQRMLEYYGVPPGLISIWRTRSSSPLALEAERLAKAALTALSMKLDEGAVIYSSSNYLEDVIPGLLLKLRHPRSVRWVVGFWMFPPRPSRRWPYGGRLGATLRGFAYYLTVMLPFTLYSRLADAHWVTNPSDRAALRRFGVDPGRVLVVMGGVDAGACLEPGPRAYDAVFVGRFHPQKGVVQLVDIWKLVVSRRPGAKLAMIGDGDLLDDVRRRIRELGLEDNVDLLGFMDGREKMEIFARSRIFVHPVIYDSGGMAPCEAMVCGLPLVTYDLETERAYYPAGSLRARPGDPADFASAVLRLLEDEELYARLSREAREYCAGWDWRRRASEALSFLRRLT
jgi:glycosyltransferase involved in cell wall biosynthesis